MYYEDSEKMDFNMEIKRFWTHVHNIISSSKCEECVLKFVSYLFVTPCISRHLSVLLNIMFHAPMGRLQSELIYYFTYFLPSSQPTLVCFFPVGLSLLIQHFQQTLWVLRRRQKKLQHPQYLLKMSY